MNNSVDVFRRVPVPDRRICQGVPGYAILHYLHERGGVR